MLSQAHTDVLVKQPYRNPPDEVQAAPLPPAGRSLWLRRQARPRLRTNVKNSPLEGGGAEAIG